jgi:uncharacterized RDD family membrane protein YckC
MEQTLELRPGRFSERFVAYLIDTVPFGVAAAASAWAWLGILRRPLGDRTLVAIGAAWLAAAALWQSVWTPSGGTPGKKLMGLAVVTADGRFPGAGRSLLRALGWLLCMPLANAGFLVALVHPRTRALDDILAGTFVVESGPRRSGGQAAFLVAALAAVGLVAFQLTLGYLKPTPADLKAIARAQDGLLVMARFETACKAKNGVYANSLDDLEKVSGDPALFRSAMRDLFAPASFTVEGGNRAWRMSAAAKDRRRTVIRLQGP